MKFLNGSTLVQWSTDLVYLDIKYMGNGYWVYIFHLQIHNESKCCSDFGRPQTNEKISPSEMDSCHRRVFGPEIGDDVLGDVGFDTGVVRHVDFLQVTV